MLDAGKVLPGASASRVPGPVLPGGGPRFAVEIVGVEDAGVVVLERGDSSQSALWLKSSEAVAFTLKSALW